jgi:hypothetical protein
MGEMIERVARAIYAVSEADIDWTEETYQAKNIVREEARAAIEAMREPTNAMVKAHKGARYRANGQMASRTEAIREGHRAAIDAALSTTDS